MRRQKVPLRIDDVWVYLGPATEHRIVALDPRPTRQKPQAQAVTLDDGRTIAEATLRYAFQRKPEYLVSMRQLRAKLQVAFGMRPECKVIQFPKRAA